MTGHAPSSRSVAALALWAALLLATAGCGGASRQVLAMRDFQEARPSPEAWARLRGIDPTIGIFWIKAALPDPERGEFSISDEESLALLEEGLGFVPDSPDLLSVLFSRLVGDTRLRDPEHAVTLARQALARMPSLGMRHLLHEVLAVALIELGRHEEAETAIVRLGGLPGASPWSLSRLWALQARSWATLGRNAEADAAFDKSLDRGQVGLWALYSMDIAPDPRQPTPPPERAASRQLVTRALQRHARHVDLSVVSALDQAHQGNFAEAELRLAELPQPLPERMQGRVVSLRAEVVIAQDRIGEGIDILLAHLDGHPTDLDALQTLAGVNAVHGAPGEEAVLDRLWTAMLAGDRGQQAQIQQIAVAVRGLGAEAASSPGAP